jgi:hypothetical protein
VGITLLVAMETNVRNDLKDLDSTNYLWATSEIDRHLQHAVNDYQRVLPLIASTDIVVASSVSAGPLTPITSRQVLTPPPAGYLWAQRVEYPIDQEPPMYLIFREEVPDGGSLYFPTGDPPVVGDMMRIWYAKSHTLSAGVSTILLEHEELIALGAVAYAATSGTRYAVGRLNASGWTPKGMAAFGIDRMKAYQAWLGELMESYAGSGTPMPQWGDWPSDWMRM